MTDELLELLEWLFATKKILLTCLLPTLPSAHCSLPALPVFCIPCTFFQPFIQFFLYDDDDDDDDDDVVVVVVVLIVYDDDDNRDNDKDNESDDLMNMVNLMISSYP